MKKIYIFLCITIASLTQLQAQAPQGFNYQATVRNNSGDLVVNTNVYFKFNVIQNHLLFLRLGFRDGAPKDKAPLAGWPNQGESTKDAHDRDSRFQKGDFSVEILVSDSCVPN